MFLQGRGKKDSSRSNTVGLNPGKSAVWGGCSIHLKACGASEENVSKKDKFLHNTTLSANQKSCCLMPCGFKS